MSHARRIVPFLLLLLLIVSACGSSEPTTGQPSPDTTRSGISHNMIIVDDLAFPVDGLNAFELVQQYKPQWLQKRGQMSFRNPQPIKVYIDTGGSAAGTVDYLKTLRVMDIRSIRRFTATEAQFRFGLDNTAGALLVTMKRGGE